MARNEETFFQITVSWGTRLPIDTWPNPLCFAEAVLHARPFSLIPLICSHKRGSSHVSLSHKITHLDIFHVLDYILCLIHRCSPCHHLCLVSSRPSWEAENHVSQLSARRLEGCGCRGATWSTVSAARWPHWIVSKTSVLRTPGPTEAGRGQEAVATWRGHSGLKRMEWDAIWILCFTEKIQKRRYVWEFVNVGN